MSRWTVSGKLSPLITPEDLALEETARAPARSCYHLQQEGLSHPLLTPCLWQCLLVFIWVLRVCQGGEKKKKYLCKKYLRWLPRKLFLFTGNGQLFVSSESYFGWLLQVWDAATGSRIEEVSELYPFPKITSFHVSLLRTALSISTGFSPWWVVRGLLPLTCKGCKFQVIYSLPDIWLTGEGWEQGSITLTCKTVSLFLGAFGYRSEDKLLGVSHTQPCKTWSGFVREDTESPYFWSPWALSWQACMEQETKHGLLLELGFPQ